LIPRTVFKPFGVPADPGDVFLRRLVPAVPATLLVLFVLAASMTTAAVTARSAEAARECRAPLPAPRRQAVRFGVHAPSAPEQGVGAAEQLQQQLGLPIGIVNWYQQWGGWGAEFDAAWVENVVASGRTPLLTWEPWTPSAIVQPDFALARIAGGAFDDYIRRWARAAAVYGKALYLRPMHEMNSDWYPWSGAINGNSADQYVAAWRHIWELFRAEGAVNVRWVWSPNAEDVPATRENAMERYYPGRRYVDVLALDGYNWGSHFPRYGGWRSFNEIFACAYRRIAAVGPQPIWIAETASAPEGGDKARWIDDMFVEARRYPRLRAIVWFHVDKERDWRATSPRRAARAFAVRA
jgi:hypothetical protein